MPLVTVAGFSVGVGGDGAARGAAVMLDAVTLELVAERSVDVPESRLPADGPRWSRELPVLLALLAALPEVPDLAFVDGHGADLPEGGVAARFGVEAGLPCIAVAREILFGTGPEPHQTRGAYTALRDPGRRQLGWLLRSKPGSAPVVVSPGHRVALASAADLVMRYTRDGRLPEPTRLACQLAGSGQGEDDRWP